MKKYAILAIILAIIAIIFGSYVDAFNYGNRMDNTIDAQYKQTENVLAQYSQRIQELVQVPTMYKDDLKEVVSATMQGRYGADGSKAVFQFIKEHNISFDSNLYKTLQQNIEAGRKDFEFENKKLIDMVNEYKIAIGSFYRGFWIHLAGFPKIDFEKFKPITNTYAKETFEKGVEAQPIKLR
jgi:hypothetical protein